MPTKNDQPLALPKFEGIHPMLLPICILQVEATIGGRMKFAARRHTN